MALPHAQRLIEQAQAGASLGTKDRRYAIAYLMAMQPGMTNVDMGELFKVSERMIRLDKQLIRQERAKQIKEDDIVLVIADIAMTLDRQMRDLERSKEKCRLGSSTYMLHCKAIHSLQLQTVEALQNLGYYPKNIGNMVIQKFEYKAVVSKDGTVNTRPVDMVIDGDVIDVEPVPKALPAPSEKVEENDGTSEQYAREGEFGN